MIFQFRGGSTVVLAIPAFILMWSAFPCFSEAPVGMILSVSGDVKVCCEGQIQSCSPASVMQLIEPGQTVETGAGASSVLALFSDDREYRVAETTRVRLDVGKLETLHGTVKAKPGSDFMDIGPTNLPPIHSLRVHGRAVYAKRDREGAEPPPAPIFLSPVPGCMILEGPLVFSWRAPFSDKRVLFELLCGEETILSTEVEGNSLSYPPEKGNPLELGKEYRARVRLIKDVALYPWPPSDSRRYGRYLRPSTKFCTLDEKAVETIRNAEQAASRKLENCPDDPTPLMLLMLAYLDHNLYPQALHTGTNLKRIFPHNPYLEGLIYHAESELGVHNRASAVAKLDEWASMTNPPKIAHNPPRRNRIRAETVTLRCKSCRQSFDFHWDGAARARCPDCGSQDLAEVAIQHVGKKDPKEEGWEFGRAENTDSCGGKYGPVDDSGTKAWSIDDDTTCSGSEFIYWRSPRGGQTTRALEYGWTLSVKVRIVDMPDSVDTIFAQYWVHRTNIDYAMAFGSDNDGDPIVQVRERSYTLEGLGSTYHLYELKYDPEQRNADLFIDGVERISDCPGRYRLDDNRFDRIAFGAGDSRNTGHGNFAEVKFEIQH
ncbi:hypothetical protein ACFLU6_08995 [Acidobacteriota bacterium]